MVVASDTPILRGVMLKSSDGYILKDKNGNYLTAKRPQNTVTEEMMLLTYDGFILQDENGENLIIEEEVTRA